MKTIQVSVIFLLGLVFSPYCLAQVYEAAIVEFPKKGHLLHTSGLSDDGLLTIIETEEKFIVITINEKGSETFRYELQKTDSLKKMSFVGAFGTSQEAQLYFLNNENQALKAVIMGQNQAPGNMTAMVTAMPGGFFAGMAYGQLPYAVYLHPKDSLILYTMGYVPRKTAVYTGQEGFTARMTADDDNKSATSTVSADKPVVIDSRKRYNLLGTVSRRKIYLENEKLYFVSDEPSYTEIWVMTPGKNKVVYKKLHFTVTRCAGDGTLKGNSFLKNGLLFRLGACKSQINLCIVSLDSFKVVRNHNLFQDSDINMANGGLLEENTLNGNREALNAKQYFSNIQSGRISVCAYVIDSIQFEVYVGACNVKESTTGNDMFTPGFSPGFSFGYGIGGFGMPGMGLGFGNPGYGYGYSPWGYNPWWGSSTSAGRTRYAVADYFRCNLVLPDMLVTLSPLPPIFNQKLEQVEEGVFRTRTQEEISVAWAPGIAWYATTVKQDSKIYFVKINKSGY